MTLAFWRLGKVRPATPLYTWSCRPRRAGRRRGVRLPAGPGGRSRAGDTRPGTGALRWSAFLPRSVHHVRPVFLILVCVNKPRLAPQTGIIAGTLVAFLVMVEAPVTGTSLNPARSSGPRDAERRTTRRCGSISPAPTPGRCRGGGAIAASGAGRPSAPSSITPKNPLPVRDLTYRLGAGETVMREGSPARPPTSSKAATSRSGAAPPSRRRHAGATGSR